MNTAASYQKAFIDTKKSNTIKIIFYLTLCIGYYCRI